MRNRVVSCYVYSAKTVGAFSTRNLSSTLFENCPLPRPLVKKKALKIA
jgi:hypothetical protein